jgi:hypothetical protein
MNNLINVTLYVIGSVLIALIPVVFILGVAKLFFVRKKRSSLKFAGNNSDTDKPVTEAIPSQIGALKSGPLELETRYVNPYIVSQAESPIYPTPSKRVSEPARLEDPNKGTFRKIPFMFLCALITFWGLNLMTRTTFGDGLTGSILFMGGLGGFIASFFVKS